ncbi:MAG: low-specificity L-threonine aldolase [Desulfobacteraceae bacterium]|nr:low-specificity L-threonine aldolase [Desulfobacteraceae bacterium]
MKQIDLRSDTVTRPTKKMLEAMMNAQVGDDVYGEDPTVNKLEQTAAQMLGMEDALFCASGTQTNLVALLGHCQRGDEYIVGQTAHTYKYEAGGGAVLGSIQPQPLDFEDDGTLDLAKVERFIKPDNFHFANTRLLCLENTQAGKVLPMAYLKEARDLADRHDLLFHLDGARVFNAAVKLGIDVKEITTLFDSVSCCLSKGLGAPVGSVLCGSKAFIARAQRWRKMVGGGMRQAGILAAAGLFALSHNIDRLTDDHANAILLAEGLSGIDAVRIDEKAVQTNMVHAEIDGDMAGLVRYLADQDILISQDTPVRLVTHLDMDARDIDRAVAGFRSFL